MTLVKGLVKDGVTILATIHSPTAYAFSLFDSLTMLVKGRVVYFGPVGQPAVDFVRSTCGKLHQAEAHIYNEAEWLVDVFAEADRAGAAEAIADAYEASPLKQAALGQVEALLTQHADLPPELAKEMAVKRPTVTPAWWGLRTLIKVGGCGVGWGGVGWGGVGWGGVGWGGVVWYGVVRCGAVSCRVVWRGGRRNVSGGWAGSLLGPAHPDQVGREVG
jgi:hypothetical protein